MKAPVRTFRFQMVNYLETHFFNSRLIPILPFPPIYLRFSLVLICFLLSSLSEVFSFFPVSFLFPLIYPAPSCFPLFPCLFLLSLVFPSTSLCFTLFFLFLPVSLPILWQHGRHHPSYIMELNFGLTTVNPQKVVQLSFLTLAFE